MVHWLRRALRGCATGPDCSEVRGQASALLDGDLPPLRDAALRRHLEGCGPCRAFVQGLRSTVKLLHSLGRVPVPPTLNPAPYHRREDDA